MKNGTCKVLWILRFLVPLAFIAMGIVAIVKGNNYGFWCLVPAFIATPAQMPAPNFFEEEK